MEVIRHPSSDADTINLEAHHIPPALINGLKRVIMSSLPCVAFSAKDVKIIRNTSYMHDSVLQERIGMIVINNQHQMAVARQPFRLQVKNSSNGLLYVTPQQIESVDFSPDVGESLPNIDGLFTYSGQILTQLRPSEEVELEMTLSLGTGLMNYASYQMGCFSTYRFKPLDDELPKRNDQILEMTKSFTRDRFGWPESIQFSIEGFGYLPPNELLLQGAQVLRELMETFLALVKDYENRPAAEIAVTINGNRAEVIYQNPTGTYNRDDFLNPSQRIHDHTVTMLYKVYGLRYLWDEIVPGSQLGEELFAKTCVISERQFHPLIPKFEIVCQLPSQLPESAIPPIEGDGSGRGREGYRLPMRFIIRTIERCVNECDQLVQKLRELS